ncbi:MAG: hypothetical protein N2Z21_11060 [Candidatus Sumerlaeaceae bacterium]|nr:hypothetical protein [Candidatus Sumerlaeaceae bacterium]
MIDAKTLEIEFGAPEWQAFLGGGFLGVEQAGPIAWNWLSDRTGWCVLPPLDVACDYRLRIEAAPIAFYGAALWDIQLWADGKKISRRVVSVEDSQTDLEIPFQELLEQVSRPPTTLKWKIRKLNRPQIRMFINDLPLAQLDFEYAPYVQTHEVLLRHELLGEKNVLTFEPSYAVSPHDIDPASPDLRQFSFRVFRLHLQALE